MNFNFSEYMNKPICPVEVGKKYYIMNELPPSENPYLVKEIVEKNGNFYAVCEHEDEFSGVKETVKVWAYELEEGKV